MARISVLIPQRNAGDAVAAQLPELCGTLEDISLDHEVIVIDDASTDRTRELEALSPGDTYLRNPQNQGVLRSCNTAATQARGRYVAFLNQAYHHVRHTTPLLMAAGSRVPADKEWLRDALAEYSEEELGHQEWVLNDIAACGYDKENARRSTPNRATELMVAYAYDVIDRVIPVGFFGMVHVGGGSSVTMGVGAAAWLQ